MAVLAEEKTTERGRLIARLATLLIRYAHPLSVLSCLAGLIALLLLPLLAKNTYISENALIPGSSNARYSNQEAKEANDLAKEILALKLSSMQNPVAIQSLLMQHMYETAEDVYFHNFLPPVNTFEPSSFFIDSSYSKRKEFKSINSSALGVNVVGIIRAPHGDGKEAIVLVTPFRSDNVDIGDALSLGLGFSLFRMFSRTIWLAKDIVWLAADSKYGAYAAVAAWLKDYHEPVFYYSSEFLKSSSPINSQNPAETKKLTFKQINYKKAGDFQRAGTIAAGLVFQVKETGIQIDKDRLDIYAEGCNGQMPNLDLINVVNFLAVHRQGLQVRVDSISHMLSWEWLACLGRMLEWLGNVVGGLNPGWKFGLSAFEYLHGAATLASSIYHQALGIPTGAHGAFRDYQVDAITLKMSPQFFLENETARMSFLLKLGRLLEGVVRSVNNLLEKFHQSFFLYFLTASSRFVSVGVYMIPFALLVVPLMILAASLCSYKHDSLSTFSKSDDKSGPLKHHEPEVTDINASQSATSNNPSGQDLNMKLGLNLQSQQWFVAAKVVLLVYLWASVIAMLPFLIYRFSIQASEMKLLIWVVLSCLTLLVGNSILGSPYTRFGVQHDAVNQFHMEGWVALKAFTLGATTIGLGIMSIINCAAALLGAIILVPMCLSVSPYKYFLKAGNVRKSLLMFLSIIFIVLAFPPVIVLTLKALLDDFSKVSIADLWNWTEILWASQSATYIYLFLVHIPCWVLCSYVLLYK
ncbi:uncharacterized protein LOC131057063 [Cryptomeria japonica]|uniref:uncharacterized protein LOC131057063 n=1 Tax=Cryptomeria japonica TaxID=3369 RepID=UPI0027D9E9C9|nr:uncharacterized protein LOC131057063 [Cryptomeria japonica]